MARGEDRPAAGADARGGAVRGVARSRVADRGSRAAVVRADAAARAAVDAARAARSRRGGAARPAAARHARRPRADARRLELPTPMRDVRALRTLALLDLESHPAEAAIDRVTIVIDPTPGRVVQHTLFTRAQPTPEQLSTLLARLGALMGQDRFGAPVAVDTDRPGAFAMAPFATDHDGKNRGDRQARRENVSLGSASSAASVLSPQPSAPACRRCAAAASRCRRASRSPTAGRCASRPIAAASPAARSPTARDRGGRRGSGGWRRKGRSEVRVRSRGRNRSEASALQTSSSVLPLGPGIATSGTCRSATGRSTACFAIATPTAGSSMPSWIESREHKKERTR